MKYTFYIAMIITTVGNTKIFKWLKVGQTNNLDRRMKELARAYHAEISVIFTYDFDNEDDSIVAECLARKLFKQRKRAEFIKNDRFSPLVPTTAEIAKLRKAFKKSNLWNV